MACIQSSKVKSPDPMALDHLSINRSPMMTLSQTSTGKSYSFMYQPMQMVSCCSVVKTPDRMETAWRCN
jgi:hypothetical protein